MTETRQIEAIPHPPHGGRRGEYVPSAPDPNEQTERPAREYVPIKTYLNNIADHALKLGTTGANRDRRRKIAKMRMMYEGDQIIRWDDEKEIYINKKKAGDALYIDPVLATFIDIITAQLAKSRSTLIVRPRSEEKVDKQQAAKYATELLRDASASLLNARNTQREIKYGFLLSGEAYRYTYFDRTVEGRGIERPKFSVKVAQGTPRAWYCQECNAYGDAETEEAGKRCPQCDFPQVQTVGGNAFQATISEGTEYENVGDVCTEFPDCLEMTVIGAKDHISDALAVIRDRMVPRCVLEMLYPDKVLPSTGTPENLRYKEAATQENETATTGEEAFEMLHFQEVWLHPAIYHGYRSPRDEKMPNGEHLKRGERIAERMPNGGYYARVGKVIVDIYEQAIKDCWSHAVNSVTSSFHGQGEWDMMPLQEQKNEVRSMQVNGLMLDSFRPLMVRNGALSQGQSIPNKAGAIVKVNNVGEDKPLSYAMDRIPGGGSIPDAYALDDKLAGSMQQRSGAFSSTTDLPDAKLLGTATGVATLAEHAVGRRAPMLGLRAEMEKEQAYQILECRQNYWPELMYESLDKKVGGDAGRWFRQSHIRRDFIIEVVPDSFMPQTAAQDAANFNQLMQVIMPLSGGDPLVLKEMRQRAIELFGRGVDIDNYEVEKVEAAVRLERLKQIAHFFETESGIPVTDEAGQPIAEMVAAVLTETTKAIRLPQVPSTAEQLSGDNPLKGMPLDSVLDNHNEYIDIYSDWMKSSEGRESSLFTRTCVRALIEKHRDAKVQQAIIEKTDANMAQSPDLQAQLVQNQAMADQQQIIGQQNAGDQLKQTLEQNDALALQSAAHGQIAADLGLNEQ